MMELVASLPYLLEARNFVMQLIKKDGSETTKRHQQDADEKEQLCTAVHVDYNRLLIGLALSLLGCVNNKAMG